MAKRKQRHGISGNPAKRGHVTGNAFSFSSAMVRPDCSECGANVRWVSSEEAASAGFDTAEGLAFLGHAAEDVDIWLCSRWPECQGAGLMPREVEGEWYGDGTSPFA